MNRQESGRQSFIRRVEAFGGDVAAYQRHIRSLCPSETCARNGARGAAVTRQRYGPRFLLQKCQSWRLDHPSRHERDVIGILDALGAGGYEREYIPFRKSKTLCMIDFAWPDRSPKLGIEVNGRPHYAPELNDGNLEGRAQHDRRRLAVLRRAGWRILVIDHRDLERDRAAVVERVRDFLDRQDG